MKNIVLSGLTAFLAGSLLAADSSPRDEVVKAAKQLGEKAGYSWKTTIVVPDDAQFRPGPTEGKTEKDGMTHLKMSFFDNTMEAVLKGDKGAVTTEAGWQSLAELDKDEGPGRFLGLMVRNTKFPVTEATQLASFAKDLKKDGDTYSGDLSEEGAKEIQLFKIPGMDVAVSGAKASVKFWLKDGALTKYEFKAKGSIKFGDNDFPNDRTTTVEIKDVGTTKVEVSEAAKKKL